MDRPYVPPASNPGGRGFSGEVSPRVFDIMSRTKGWVRFIAVMLWVNVVVAIINVIVTLSSARLPNGDAQKVGQVVGIAIALLFYIYPAVKLNSYARRIGVLLQSGRAGDLEAALNEHRAFWRFVGIVTLVFIGIFVVAMVVGVAGAVLSSRS